MLLQDPTLSGTLPARDLVAEANHRIANSLAAISSLVQHQASAIDADGTLTATEVRRVLGEVRARVDAVARLHRALSDSGDEPVDVGGYVQQIASELVSSLSSPDRPSLHFLGEIGCRIAPERALYLGLIVIELVTNSLKYAHPTGVPGEIAIHCRREGHMVRVDVSDDGVGLPEAFDLGGSRTSGLRLVRSLAEQIGGTVAFTSEGLGLHGIIRAPVLTSR